MASRPKTPVDIRCTYRRVRIPLEWAAKVDDCKRLCAHFHNLFGACLVLDDTRFSALCGRLVLARIPADDIAEAIDAYHAHVLADPWYREGDRRDPTSPSGTKAHRTLAKFLEHESFEKWLQEGRLRRAQRLCPRPASNVKATATAHTALLQRFESLDHQARRALIERASQALRQANKPDTAAALKAKCLELLSEPRAQASGPEATS